MNQLQCRNGKSVGIKFNNHKFLRKQPNVLDRPVNNLRNDFLLSNADFYFSSIKFIGRIIKTRKKGVSKYIRILFDNSEYQYLDML